jgi:hypothetical protein
MLCCVQAVPDRVPGGGPGHVHHCYPRGDDSPRHQEVMLCCLQAVPDRVPGGGPGHVHHCYPRGHDATRHQEEVWRQLQERTRQDIHCGEFLAWNRNCYKNVVFYVV